MSTYTPFTIASFPSNPLTTTFTGPADCSGTSRNVLMVDPATSCLPSGFSTAATDFFSPGIACPLGYWSACHDTTGVASITTVTCCPHKKKKRGGVTMSCVDPATLSSPWVNLYCTWIAPASPGTTVSVTHTDNGKTRTAAEVISSAGGANAYGIRMVYQAKDLLASSTTSPAQQTGTGTGGAASQTDTSTTTSTPSPSPGLSTGASVAIAVVIPVVVLAALAGLFFWWRKRKQRIRRRGHG
ncbi:hypothetical protein QBC46DRAFT_257792 [Diplogelasinospora grovesii]|uniref:Uncharacterized protein n=1 Tax=Diplogelasinospora grovesii TaxID=303347 RepID=A0AAN6NCM9_9PEZI|nr:hypothetical protein QBC46DRAFT_257792 [Diplogelasinospora grovesii]